MSLLRCAYDDHQVVRRCTYPIDTSQDEATEHWPNDRDAIAPAKPHTAKMLERSRSEAPNDFIGKSNTTTARYIREFSIASPNQANSTFCFDLVAVRLMLRLEVEVLVRWTQEHFAEAQIVSIACRFKFVRLDRHSPDLDPVFVVCAAQQRLQIASTLERWWSVSELWRQVLEKANRNITTAEAQPFKQELPRCAHANLI